MFTLKKQVCLLIVAHQCNAGRMGIESDMAGAILYLSSSAGTGDALVSDGGLTLNSIPFANKLLAKI